MALINCSECGKEINDKAVSCPHCGCPINEHTNNLEEEFICYPKCHSKELHAEQDFSEEQALAGADDELKHIIETQGMLEAVKFYKEKTGLGLYESKKYVDKYANRKGIHPQTNNGGCAGVLLLFIILAGSIICIL